MGKLSFADKCFYGYYYLYETFIHHYNKLVVNILLFVIKNCNIFKHIILFASNICSNNIYIDSEYVCTIKKVELIHEHTKYDVTNMVILLSKFNDLNYANIKTYIDYVYPNFSSICIYYTINNDENQSILMSLLEPKIINRNNVDCDESILFNEITFDGII